MKLTGSKNTQPWKGFPILRFVYNAEGWEPWTGQVHHSLPWAFGTGASASISVLVPAPWRPRGSAASQLPLLRHGLHTPPKTWDPHTSPREEEEGAAVLSHCWSFLEALQWLLHDWMHRWITPWEEVRRTLQGVCMGFCLEQLCYSNAVCKQHAQRWHHHLLLVC